MADDMMLSANDIALGSLLSGRNYGYGGAWGEDLAPEVYGSYTGFKFTCPNCGKPSIMVNNDMGDFCTCCGQKVLVKSKTVTEYLNRKR